MKSAFQRKRNLLMIEDWRYYAIVAEAFFVALSPWLASFAAIAGVVLWLVQMKMDEDLHFRRLPYDNYVLAFAIISGASVISSPNPALSFYNYYNLVGIYMATYLLAGQTVRNETQLRHVVEALTLGAVIVVAYGFFQYFFGIDESNIKWVDPEAFPELKKRVFSTWENPNILAGYLDEVIVMAIAFLVTMKEKSTRIAIGTFIVCLAACLAMTYARGAVFSLVIVVFLYGVLRDWRVLVGLVVLCGAAFMIDPVLAERIASVFTGLDTSSEMRLAIWESTGDMILDHPFLGIGWGSYLSVYPEYDFYINDLSVKIYHAHNMYLNYAAEIGLFGAASFMWNFFGTMWRSFRRSLTDDVPFMRAFHLGTVMALATIAIGGITDFVLFNIPTSMLFWMMCALSHAEPDDTTMTKHDILKEALQQGIIEEKK